MKIFAMAIVLAAVTWPSFARADEQTREIQEELRKRHVFYGDIDGQMTPALSAALKRYQEHKHLAVTGKVDYETLRSLGISSPAPPAEGAPDKADNGENGELPDVAVLRSDSHVPNKSIGLPPARQPAPTPQPVALKASTISRAEAQEFLRSYFTACQDRNIDEELRFYGDRVNYYDHGTVDRTYIRNELVVYDQHWPLRRYTVANPPRVSKQGNDAVLHCRTAFNVSNTITERHARGRTNNMFELGRRPDSTLEIVSIHESRVRANSRRHYNPIAGVVRRVSGAMRSLLP